MDPMHPMPLPSEETIETRKKEGKKRKTGREEEMCDVGHKATESYGDSPVPQVR